MGFRVQRVHLLLVVQSAVIVILMALQLLPDSSHDTSSAALKPLHLAATLPNVHPVSGASGPRQDAEASCAPCQAPQQQPQQQLPCKPQQAPAPPTIAGGATAPGPGPYAVSAASGLVSRTVPHPLTFEQVAVGVVTDGNRFAPNADRFYHEWGHLFPHFYYAADFAREAVNASISAPEYRPRVLRVEGNSIAERLLTLIRPLYEAAPPTVQWFFIADDDTAAFPENLLAGLGQYDPTYPWYVGALSEDVTSLFRHGHAAYGGAGYALSRPLMHAFAYSRGMDAGVACLALMRDKKVFAGDEATGICLANLGVTVSLLPGLHQMDMKGDLSPLVQLLYGHDPLISLHHLYTCKPLFARFLLDAAAKPTNAEEHEEAARWMALRHWYSAYRAHPPEAFNLLQYEAVPALGVAAAWNLGASLRLYPGMYPGSHYTGRYLPFVYSAWGGGYINFDLLPSGGISEKELCAGAYFEWAKPAARAPPPPGSLSAGEHGDWHVYTREWRRDFCRPIDAASTHGAIQRVLVRVEPCLMERLEPSHPSQNASLRFADGALWSGLLGAGEGGAAASGSGTPPPPPPPVTRPAPSRVRLLQVGHLRAALVWVATVAGPALFGGEGLRAASLGVVGGRLAPGVAVNAAAWTKARDQLTAAADAGASSELPFAAPLLGRGTLSPAGVWTPAPTAAHPGTADAAAQAADAALADLLGLYTLVPAGTAIKAADSSGSSGWWAALLAVLGADPAAGGPATSIPPRGALADSDPLLLVWSSSCASRPAAVRRYPIMAHADYFIPESFRPF